MRKGYPEGVQVFGFRNVFSIALALVILLSSIGGAGQPTGRSRNPGDPTMTRADIHHSTASWHFQDLTGYRLENISEAGNGAGLTEVGSNHIANLEFVVSEGPGDQGEPAVAFDSNDNAIVTWADSRNGTNSDIYAKIFNATTGQQIGSEIVICGEPHNQSGPIIAVNSRNEFFVLWQDQRSGSYPDFYARLFCSGSGLPAGPEMLVCNGSDFTNYPSIAIDRDDNCIVVWQELRHASYVGLFAKVFNTTTGEQIGSEIKITDRTPDPWFPAVVADQKNNNYIIGWTDGFNISVQIIECSTHAQVGDEILIPYNSGFVFRPSLAVNRDDDLVVTWTDIYQAYDSNICAQIFDSSTGSSVGSKIIVHSEVCKTWTGTVVSTDTIGNFMVAWDDFRDGYNRSIYARILNITTGSGVGDEIPVCDAAEEQYVGSVAASPNDDFIVTWSDRRNHADFDIYARAINPVYYHSNNGSATTGDLFPQNLHQWLSVSSDFILQNPSANNVTVSYSTDSGSTWTPTPAIGTLPAIDTSFGRIRFRIALTTLDNTTTPIFYSLALNYIVNVPPSVSSFPSGDVTTRNRTIPLSATVSDADNDPLACQWSLEGPAGALLTNATSRDASFRAQRSGNYTVRFNVSDGYASVERAVNMSVMNHPPKIIGQESLFLFKGGSTVLPFNAVDEDEDPLVYLWEFVGDPNGAIIAGPSIVAPTLAVPRAGNIDLRLTVSDGELEESTILKVVVVGHPPVAILALDRANVEANETVLFDASSSYDRDNDALQYRFDFGDGTSTDWQYGPIAGHSYGTSGNYSARLDVRDSDGNGSSSSPVRISVRMQSARPPTVRITSPQDNAGVTGRFVVTGTARNGSSPLWLVQVRIDGGTWKNARGLENWTLEVDSTGMRSGAHRVEARAFDGTLYSETASVNFRSANPGRSVSSEKMNWLVPGVFIAAVCCMGGLLLMRKRMGKPR